MPAKRPFHENYHPTAEQLALFPPVSGNVINGVGEADVRQPTPLYWFDPDTIPHGKLQKYFYQNAGRFADKRRVTSQMTEQRGPEVLDDVAVVRAQDTPETFARRVKEFALAHEADLVGIAAMDPLWVFEGHAVDAPWIVVIGLGMDQRELAKGPPRAEDVSSADEVSRQYNRAARASKALRSEERRVGKEEKGRSAAKNR